MLSPRDIEILLSELMADREREARNARLRAQAPRLPSRWRQWLVQWMAAKRPAKAPIETPSRAKSRLAANAEELMQPEITGVWIALSLIVILLGAVAILPA